MASAQSVKPERPVKRRKVEQDDQKAGTGPSQRGHGTFLEQPAGVAAYQRGSSAFLDKPVKKSAVKNKKLAAHLSGLAAHHKSTAKLSYEHDHLLLSQENTGLLQAEDELERTWRVSQEDIKGSIGVGAAKNGFDLELPTYGPYALDYTANGRHLAIAGRLGHVATFDWQAGRLGTEMHLNETVRDVCWLHNQSFFAVAQKKYVYIYDNSGLEVHQLRQHIEVNKMQFLRYHFLLATVGNAGVLKYQDTSTGTMVSEAKTKLGTCDVMAQNPHSGIVNLGHQNGTVTLWSPTTSQPHVKLLAHLGPVRAVSVDPSSSGNYLATAGLDGRLKVWDMRSWGVVNEWKMPTPAKTMSFSQKGLLSIGWGNHVSVYRDATKSKDGQRLGPYMTNAFPGRGVRSLRFCPYDDVLGVGHAAGLTHMLVPGAGEVNYDALEADPFETRTARREREVNSLLDKIQPDQITMDRDLIGKLARPDEAKVHPDPKLLRGQGAGRQVPYARKSRVERLHIDGKAPASDEEGNEEADAGQEQVDRVRREKRKQRVKGANKVTKRLKRGRQNVVDAETMARKEKAAQYKEQKKREAEAEASDAQAGGALERFTRPIRRL